MKLSENWRDRTPIVWNGRPSRQQVFESTDPVSPPALVITSDPLMRDAVAFLAHIGGVAPLLFLFAFTWSATVPWAWLYYFPIGVLTLVLALSLIIFNWDFETAWIAVKFGWLAVPMSWILLVLYACAKAFEKGRSPMRTISVTEDRIRISGESKKGVKRSRAERIQVSESGQSMMDGWCTQEELVSVSIFGKRWRLAELFLCHPSTALAIADQLSQATGLPIVYEDSDRRESQHQPLKEDHEA